MYSIILWNIDVTTTRDMLILVGTGKVNEELQNNMVSVLSRCSPAQKEGGIT